QDRAPPTKTDAIPEHPSLILGPGCTTPAVLLPSKSPPPSQFAASPPSPSQQTPA
ncbi:hypothetical protein FIBSPDRAFT_877080, partial [Athelia psychrophila]